MKVKATISPTVNEKGESKKGTAIYLSGAYRHNSIMRVLTETGDVVDWSGLPKDMPKAQGVYLHKTKPEIVIEYEDDEKISRQLDALGHRFNMQKKRQVEVFYANHVNLTVNGKKHTTSIDKPDFNMVISTDVLAEKYSTFRDELLVKNRINSMEYEERAAVADYFGISPKDKTELDLLVELAGDNGICIQHPTAKNPSVKDNLKDFLRNWMSPSADTMLMVNIRKAIRLKVIEEKKTAGRVDYYLGTTHIGTQVEDIITYCRANQTIYTDHILRKVREEKFETEKEATEKLEQKIEGNAPMSQSEIQDLRNEAVQLKKEKFIPRRFRVDVMGANPESLKKLQGLVEQAKKDKEAKLVVA